MWSPKLTSQVSGVHPVGTKRAMWFSGGGGLWSAGWVQWVTTQGGREGWGAQALFHWHLFLIVLECWPFTSNWDPLAHLYSTEVL